MLDMSFVEVSRKFQVNWIIFVDLVAFKPTLYIHIYNIIQSNMPFASQNRAKFFPSQWLACSRIDH